MKATIERRGSLLGVAPLGSTVAARRSRRLRRLQRGLLYLLAVALGLTFMVPFFWSVMGSFKTPFESTAIPPTWFPEAFQFENYRTVYNRTPFPTFLRNTVILTAANVAGDVLSSAAVAYGFARYRFPGRNALFLLLMSRIMLPREITVIPQYWLFSKIGWLDTYYPLIVPQWFAANSFGVFLLRQFFLTIPRDYDDAARMDGASSFKIFWQIILPLSFPALVALAIFDFISNWTSFFEPLIYLNTQSKLTLAVGLTWFQSTGLGTMPKQPLLLAYSLMMTAPIIVVFFLAQRYFIRGIVMSGVKG